MGMLKNIFKNKNTVDNILDKDNGLLAKVGAHIGNKKFTEEEQRESDLKEVEMIQEFVKNTLTESSLRSKSRRFVTFLWIGLQVSIFVACAVSAPFDRELAAFYFDLATNNVLLMGTTAIIAFFYGSHLLRTKK